MRQPLVTEKIAEERDKRPKPVVLSPDEGIGDEIEDKDLILADDGYPDTDDFRMD